MMTGGETSDSAIASTNPPNETGRPGTEAVNREPRGLGKPETLNFLGFTFICGQSRRGGLLIKRKPRADRMRAKLGKIKEGLRRRMHCPIAEQGAWLKPIVAGWDSDFTVPTSLRALAGFRRAIVFLWMRVPRRRSQKDRTSWRRMAQLAREFIPEPRILHPWPELRFAAKHPRREPYAGKPRLRF